MKDTFVLFISSSCCTFIEKLFSFRVWSRKFPRKSRFSFGFPQQHRVFVTKLDSLGSYERTKKVLSCCCVEKVSTSSHFISRPRTLVSTKTLFVIFLQFLNKTTRLKNKNKKVEDTLIYNFRNIIFLWRVVELRERESFLKLVSTSGFDLKNFSFLNDLKF